jgi:hypothetical protein
MYTIIYNKYYCYNATDLNSKYERNSTFNIIIKQFIYRTSADSQEENKFQQHWIQYNMLLNKVNFPEFKLTIAFKSMYMVFVVLYIK